jgi:Schlafen, AlbA_2
MDIEAALAATEETAAVDFKERFDPTAASDWCELVKDIVAIANSGGGYILIGVTDDGVSIDYDPLGGIALDPATVSDKIFRYTGEHLGGVTLHRAMRHRKEVMVIAIDATRSPVVFSKPGSYPVDGNRQKTAFSQGTIYFRHGAKSETATTQDLRQCIQCEVAAQREEWMGNVRRVVEAPPGSVVTVAKPGATVAGTAMPVRLVNDESAREVPHWDPDKTHPYRQKELVAEINRRLDGRHRITTHDVQCIRRVHGIDDDPHFSHKTRYSSRQFSDAFAEWTVTEFDKDSAFFAETRRKVRVI